MICPRCGAQNREGITFCATCGAPLVAGARPAPTAPPAPSRPRMAVGLGRLGLGGMVAGVLGATLVAALLGLAVTAAHSDTTPNRVAAFARGAGERVATAPATVAGGAVAPGDTAGWTVEHDSAGDYVLRGHGGLVEWFIATSVPAATSIATIPLDDVVAAQQQHAQANLCEDPVDVSGGLAYALCYTDMAEAAGATAIEQLHVARFVTVSGDRELEAVVATCPQPGCDDFLQAARPLITGTKFVTG